MLTKTVLGILVLLMLFSLHFVYYLKSDAGYSKFPLNSSRFNLTMKKSKITPLAQLELDFQDYLKSIQEPRNCSAVEVLRCGQTYCRCYVLVVISLKRHGSLKIFACSSDSMRLGLSDPSKNCLRCTFQCDWNPLVARRE